MSMLSLFGFGGHHYTLCFERGGKLRTKTFCSRHAANEEMYRLIGKYRLQIAKVYNDSHSKTYICECGSKFFINRA